jgi:hypothetical protein
MKTCFQMTEMTVDQRPLVWINSGSGRDRIRIEYYLETVLTGGGFTHHPEGAPQANPRSRLISVQQKVRRFLRQPTER